MEAKATAVADAKRISGFLHGQKREAEARRDREYARQRTAKAEQEEARRAEEAAELQDEQSRSQPINFQDAADPLINSAREAANHPFQSRESEPATTVVKSRIHLPAHSARSRKQTNQDLVDLRLTPPAHHPRPSGGGHEEAALHMQGQVGPQMEPSEESDQEGLGLGAQPLGASHSQLLAMHETPREIRDKLAPRPDAGGGSSPISPGLSHEHESPDAGGRLKARFTHGGERSPSVVDPDDAVRNQGTSIAEDELGMDSCGLPTHVGSSLSDAGHHAGTATKQPHRPVRTFAILKSPTHASGEGILEQQRDKIPERYRVQFAMNPHTKNQRSEVIHVAKPAPPTLVCSLSGSATVRYTGTIASPSQRHADYVNPASAGAPSPTGHHTAGAKPRGRRPQSTHFNNYRSLVQRGGAGPGAASFPLTRKSQHASSNVHSTAAKTAMGVS